jgi:aldehyde:ferredoxin oxidoreductase
MNNNLNPSEEFVFNLYKQSFLQLWTHPSPIGKNGKELCDCLIVCGSHIIIISVKKIQYKDTGDITGFERWTKSAIEKSASQIWGAERWLRKVNIIERNDGCKITLPHKSKRKYHRVAVALGGKG